MDFWRRIADSLQSSSTTSFRCSALASLLSVVLLAAGCKSWPGRKTPAEARLEADDDSALVVASSSVSTFELASSSVSTPLQIPPKPTQTSSYSEDLEEWPLSLNEALSATLSNNRQLIVSQIQPQITEHQICIEESIFDPTISLGGQWSENDSQITSIVQGPGFGVTSATTNLFGPPKGVANQAGISKKLQSGGEITAGMSSNYQYSNPGGQFLLYNPLLRSTAQIELSQPLFKGAGSDISRIRIRMAQDGRTADGYRLEISIRQIVSQTAMAYWKLYGARARLESREQGVQEAETVLRQENEKLALGASSNPEVAAARAQLEQFRVNRALTRRDVADAERDLRTLMGISLEDGRKIIPATEPLLNETELDWEAAVIAANHQRPEIQLQKSSLHLAQLQHHSAHDGLRPDVRGYAGLGVSGSASNLNGSLQTMASGNYENWWTGVVYQKQLGGQSARSMHEQSRLVLSRELATLEMTEQDMYEELHAAYQRVTNAWEVMQLSAARKSAATEVVEARKEMHALREMSLQDYLSALSAWEQAVSDERQAIADYNTAIIEWEYARGSILTYQHIDFASQIPVETDAP